jgi:hypothetical protein
VSTREAFLQDDQVVVVDGISNGNADPGMLRS